MKLKGQIPLTGHLTIKHSRNGEVLSEVSFHNTITNMGIDQVAGLINGTRDTAFTYLRLGTSEVQASATQTDLLAGITAGSLSPAAATATQITTDTTNDTSYLVHSWAATASYGVKECAIATSATGGRILGRKTFSAKNMSSGDTLTVYYGIDVD